MTDTPAPPPAPYLGQFITETTEVTVPFTTAVLVLDRDGSRRIVMHTLADSGEFYHWHTQRERLGVRADGAPMVFWGVSNAPQLYNGLHPGKYLPYPPADGIAVPAVDDPVNPVPYLLPYRSHAARFAHQLDDAMGHHTLQSATEEDRLTVYHALVFMIGVAARKYQEWGGRRPARNHCRRNQ